MESGIINLQRHYFIDSHKEIFRSENITINLFRYPSGVEAIEVKNLRGRMVVLPYMGQMIWDLEFDGLDLKMKNMFSQPKKVANVVDTYGCFAFHSGLLRNGCPGPEDDYELHGEMACADMDRAWLEITNQGIKICGETEYVKGFGDHYLARPTVEMFNDETFIELSMSVKNLSGSEMPLQYMCHTNYAYKENAIMKQNIPDSAFKLRETIPDHVKPTEKWLKYNQRLLSGEDMITKLDQPGMYDPEIVFFVDELDKYQSEAEFEMILDDENSFFTRFSTVELNYATRWILHNSDQQVGAFVLPATCRPEGFMAAKKSGTLIMLKAGEEKSFTVTTGKK